MSGELRVPPYAGATADYGNAGGAPRSTAAAGAGGGAVSAVREGSPAWDAGIEAGMVVTTVAGRPLKDMIDWLWEADGETVELEVLDPSDGTVSPCTLERLPGEDWGVEFDGAVFDGMRTCVNACVFCFMTMLPPHMRGTLYIRDDDYRLSFLQGNFVTLTNMTDEEVQRVIDLQLSPMNVSLHAVTPEVRRRLMGRRAQRGMEVLRRLIDAGIEIHAQIVLCPGINDGDELERTLAFCEENPGITSMGIVPMGYTRFQKRFQESYSDHPEAARAVIEQVRPHQVRARGERGRTVFQLSDEFYLDAGVEVPPAETYDGYPQFYDGIGMIRYFLDETARIKGEEGGRLAAIARRARERGVRIAVVSGAAAAPTVEGLIADGPIGGRVLVIRNDYFGGNVDVTGLICGGDLLAQLPSDLQDVMLFLPEVIFNADGMTLDGYHRRHLCESLEGRGASVHVTSTQPADVIDSIERALASD